VPDGTSQYEVKATLNLPNSGGYYYLLLHASTDALPTFSGAGSAGTYYQVALLNPTFSGNTCTAWLSVAKRSQGVFTGLALNTAAPCFHSMTLRAVSLPGNAIALYLNDISYGWITDTSIAAGQPGIAVGQTPAGNSISNVSLGPLDRLAPASVNLQSLATAVYPNEVDMQWQGVSDDTNGTGISGYVVYRNGAYFQWTTTTELTDATVAPSTTYSYTFYPGDYHGNNAAPVSVSITTPPPSATNPRRVGVRPPGTYWGAQGEQIDMWSGNLNFTLPLIQPKARNGWGVKFALSYNSQLWRQDPGGTWKLGRDVGYGFGWKLMAGAVTPYWSDPYTIHHYLYTDATGAEYRLTVNYNGVWSSPEGIRVWYDSGAHILHFRDGSFWVMGAVSGGTEQDTGTLYPTVMEDSNRNQILIQYYPGLGTSSANSSALAQNSYDLYGGSCDPGGPLDVPNLLAHDVNYGTAFRYRGNLSSQLPPASDPICTSFDITGTPRQIVSGGHTLTNTPANNNAVPGVLTPNSTASLANTFGYDLALHLTSLLMPGGASAATSYDLYGRPSGSTSPYGASTTYSYTYNPNTVTANTNNHWTRKTLDGFGRETKSETGYGATTVSVVTTTYGPCACSPLGKVVQVSQPYAPGASTIYYTVYTYDALGRVTRVRTPDGASQSSYAYQGNRTTVTDPAGRWKTYTRDAMENLTQVTEPNPAGGADLVTSYTYNSLNKLTQVSMPRGGYTQTRTFTYDGAGRVLTATNPENGTVTYTYNGDGTVATKRDAKGTTMQYSYDGYGRLTQVSQSGVTYYTNTYDSAGRLATVSFGANWGAYTYTYGYTAGGLVASKAVGLNRGNNTATLEVDYTYDNEGRMVTVTSPTTTQAGTTYTYTYDALGRPTALAATAGPAAPATLAGGAQYGPAGELLSLTTAYGQGSYTETRTYNSRLQLTQIAGSGMPWGQGPVLNVNLQYTYSATQNNGQITQFRDGVSGEQVSYGYDSLNRLISASASSGAWGQSFTYDGFGNLRQKTVTQGSAPTLSVAVDPATNRMVGQSYDANGNLLYNGAVYDALNRVWQIYQYGSLNTEGYAYGPNNERVEKVITANGTSNYYTYLYGVDGCRLGVYQPTIDGTGRLYFQGGSAITPCFGGRMLYTKAGQLAVADRLGSIRPLNGSQTATTSYYPYGEEQPQQSTEDTERFATYYRDSTNLDYAVNRYYSSQFGRFVTPDPSGMDAAELSDPGSWNMYTYVGDDPINLTDPDGLIKCADALRPETGQTFGSLINAKGDVGLLARVVWAESDNGAYNGFQTQNYFDEKAAVAVSIVNRVDILNNKILISNGRSGYVDPGTLGWGPVGASLSQVLNQPGQYASVSGGDINQAFRNSLDKVLNEDATSMDCIAAINSWQAALYALEHILKDPFGDQGVTTSFHHGNQPSPQEIYFGTFNSLNNFFGIPESRVVYNPSGTPLPRPRPIRPPHPPRRPVQ